MCLIFQFKYFEVSRTARGYVLGGGMGPDWANSPGAPSCWSRPWSGGTSVIGDVVVLLEHGQGGGVEVQG